MCCSWEVCVGAASTLRSLEVGQATSGVRTAARTQRPHVDVIASFSLVVWEDSHAEV